MSDTYRKKLNSCFAKAKLYFYVNRRICEEKNSFWTTPNLFMTEISGFLTLREGESCKNSMENQGMGEIYGRPMNSTENSVFPPPFSQINFTAARIFSFCSALFRKKEKLISSSIQ